MVSEKQKNIFSTTDEIKDLITARENIAYGMVLYDKPNSNKEAVQEVLRTGLKMLDRAIDNEEKSRQRLKAEVSKILDEEIKREQEYKKKAEKNVPNKSKLLSDVFKYSVENLQELKKRLFG